MAKAKLTEENARSYAALLTTTVGTLRQLEAEMNLEINQIKETFTKKSLELANSAKEYEKILAKYAAENPEIFPAGKKSTEWGSVTISKRTTTPKVGIPSGAKWEDAVAKLKVMDMTTFVRTVEEVDKEGIISAIATDDGDKVRSKLALIGITVTQTEKINIEVREQELVNA